MMLRVPTLHLSLFFQSRPVRGCAVQCVYHTHSVMLSQSIHQIPRCNEMLKAECIDRFDTMSCTAAAEACDAEIAAPFWSSGLNPYDISKECDGPIEETLCYPITNHIANYLNRPETRKMLGVSKKVDSFRGCSDTVGIDFYEHVDRLRQTALYVEQLLERGIRVLVYVGTYDWIW